jgi:hypothetical protein
MNNIILEVMLQCVYKTNLWWAVKKLLRR